MLPMSESPYNLYRQLCREIERHNHLYFDRAAPEIEDAAYDQLMVQLREQERSHPEWIGAHSPTQRVGERTSAGFAQISHRARMLSFDKVFSDLELLAFDKRLLKDLPPPIVYSVEAKMDGCAVAVWYRQGQLERGLTRGNGEVGDDVTRNISTIATLPKRLKGANIPDFLELRGEVFLSASAFARINQERERERSPPFANPRNLASGTLKMLQPELVARRELSILFYAVGEDSSRTLKSFDQSREWMRAHHLPVLEVAGLARGIDEVVQRVEEIKAARAELDFGIDGAVVKVNDFATGQDLGYTGQYYRWGIAYKFTAERALSQILAIELQVGRTGVVTPVAQLKPVALAGTCVSRATLHNASEVRRRDIRPGDFVYIEKGGDIIPKVVEIALERRPSGLSPWQFPTHCPACKTALIAESIHLRCPNSLCGQQLLGQLAHFVSKKGMDIEGLGPRVLELLVQLRGIHSPAQLYHLRPSDLEPLPGFGERSARALCDAIRASRRRPLAQFLIALGIAHIGREAAESLARELGTFEKLRAAGKEQLLAIDGIGDKGAGALRAYLQDPGKSELLRQLELAGVDPQGPRVEVRFAGHPFQQKSFVITGSLERLSRSEAIALIQERGGHVSASLSKKIDYLIVGQNPGSKLDKALAWKITRLSETQFAQLLSSKG